ncbi:fibrinogen- and Ig-binding protein-like [Lytechinus variegatus]|uniref:fibrinogen- and Ig-binding protein-like n=1 Tax=Lytechinus variegatus TaxID=7654 RepID=UPI001BB2204F|nr:fibrinogen- and Ig-binding protein-like [Lytechinus variegatus]
MFAPPKKGTRKQITKKKQILQGTERKSDVRALVKDFNDSYRQLDDYVTKENEEKRQWNKNSPDKSISKASNTHISDTYPQEATKTISNPSNSKSNVVGSSSKPGPRKLENIYGEGKAESKEGESSTSDVQRLLDAYPKRFQELRQLMEEMKDRHAKSINRLRHKLKKDALKQQEETKEVAKREAQEETDRLRHLLKVQKTKSQRALENMKSEKQKLVTSQAKSNKTLRQTENKLADMQKGLFTVKKQFAKIQREKVISDKDRAEQRSKAVKEKKRADRLQKDFKSLEAGIQTVRLLNRQNENVTQHDYDVLQWKFRSIVKLVREVDSITTPPDLGRMPSLEKTMEAGADRGLRVRLPAIGYPRRPLMKGEQRALQGRQRMRQIIYPQKKVVHQIPRRNDQHAIEGNPKEETLALPMPEEKPGDFPDDSPTTDSTGIGHSPTRSSWRSHRDEDRREDHSSDSSSDTIRENQNSRNQSGILTLPPPDGTPSVVREFTQSSRESRSDSCRTLSRESAKGDGSTEAKAIKNQTEKSDTSDDNTEQTMKSGIKDEEEVIGDREEDLSVFLT